MLLSRALNYDFVRLEGLQKLTITAHDWDIYILKELIDNALDADEADPSVTKPHIHAVVQYIENRLGEHNERSLFIEVSNLSRFPLERLDDLFDLDKRVSDKHYYNVPTRGAQGNALKTILGIPYALSYYYFSTYKLDLDPLVIRYGDEQVAIMLDIDKVNEQMTFHTVIKPVRRPETITKIAINIQRFFQQIPRKIEDLKKFAQSFALFNPHAHFDFEFIFTRNDGTRSYDERDSFSSQGNANWSGKYNHQQPSPIHWYKLDEFCELVYALVRQVNRADYQLGEVLREFGITRSHIPTLPDHTPIQTIVNDDGKLQVLYDTLVSSHLRTEPIYLGEISKDYLYQNCSVALSEKDDKPLFFYRYFTNPSIDTNKLPFTIEMALYVNSGTGERRKLHIGINHTPTYADPFFNKILTPVDMEDKNNTIRGLEKLMDAYGLTDEMPIGLIIHIISPNVLYENYGKIAISHEPYRQIIPQLLSELVKEYEEAIRKPEPIDYLTEPARELLIEISNRLKEVTFNENQLLSELRKELTNHSDENIRADLTSDTADNRLIAVIRERPIDGMQRRQSGRLAVPNHPKNITHVLLSMSRIDEIVRDYGIRAIIISNSPTIEELLISLSYPLYYDVGILRADGNLSVAMNNLIEQYQEILTNYTQEDDTILPALWIVRDATPEAIQATRHTLERIIDNYHIRFEAVYDLGLHPKDASHYALVREKSAKDIDTSLLITPDEHHFYLKLNATAFLESISPLQFGDWFETQLDTHQLSRKYIPSFEYLIKQANPQLMNWFKAVIIRLASAHYHLDTVEQELIQLWKDVQTDWDKQLYHDILRDMNDLSYKKDTWIHVLNRKLDEIFEKFWHENETAIKRLISDND